ncbi:MAG TPA: ABC transporter permease [Candidatus Limnocylindria bacterium]|nr:ABC transporter permease [Candidatus Limnocylindria bacterium]
MGKYLVRRVLRGLLTVFISVSFTFFLLRLIPADPVSMMVDPKMSAATVAKMTAQFGLDKPLFVQYFIYLGQLLQGNFGVSFKNRDLVMAVLMQKLPWTLLLLSLSVSLSLAVGIPIGIRAANRRNGLFDRSVNVVTMIGISLFIPFLSFSLLYLFGYLLRLLPTGGAYTPPPMKGFAYVVDVLRHAILPTFTLFIGNCTSIILYTRNSMIDVQKEDYIRTAYAKGWDSRYVTRTHALKNAMIPTITATGIMISHLMGGAIMTESIYSWPGIGRLIFDSVSALDYPVLQGAFLFLSATTVLINILTDLSLAWIDPRVKLGGVPA